MSYFLGFFPDDKSINRIKKVIRELSQIFNDFGIPVRWVKPETFHISLYYLGERYSILSQYLLNKKLQKLKYQPIDISLGNIKVGISRNYKELVYIDLYKGGDQLRELLLNVRNLISCRDTSMFVPHLTIGRISKDLSPEEYRNLVKDISNISKRMDLTEIQFTTQSLCLMESKNGVYTIKKGYSI